MILGVTGIFFKEFGKRSAQKSVLTQASVSERLSTADLPACKRAEYEADATSESSTTSTKVSPTTRVSWAICLQIVQKLLIVRSTFFPPAQ